MKNSWLNYEQFLVSGFEWADKKRRIVKGYIPETLSLEFHRKMPKGAALRELQKQPLHLAYWETKYYKEAISKFLLSNHFGTNVVADIGCGDGRFTEHLIDIGYTKIIATDIDIRPLISLSDFLEIRGDRDKVILINCCVQNFPLKDSILDAALCIGVLYYLNDSYEDGLREVCRLLKDNAILINSEPELEGAIYKSIFFEQIQDVFENYFERKFKEEKGKTPFKFRLFTEEEMISILSRNGQSVVDKSGLSLLPSIVRIMMLRGLIDEDELKNNEDKIREVMDFLNFSSKLNKHIIWKSVKNS